MDPPAVDATVDVVLFDLDGTLSDSAPGILASLRHAFAVNGLPPMDPRTEQSLLGPPFYDSLPPLVGADNVWPVIEAYREHYRGGSMLDTTAYPGVVEVLSTLHDHGIRLAVATSKPEYYAVPIVEHLGLTGYFETIGGDAPDGSLGTKALVIGKVLNRLGRPDPARILMVGDREHDVFGAAEHSIASVGAGWGYGLPGELVAAGAEPVCSAPLELLAIQRLARSVAVRPAAHSAATAGARQVLR